MSSVLKPAHQMSLAAYCIPKKRWQYVLANVYGLLPLRRKKETANPCNISPNKSLAFKRITQIDKLEFQLVKRWIPKMRHLDGFFHAPPRPGDLLKSHQSGLDNARLVKKNGRVGQPVTIGITCFYPLDLLKIRENDDDVTNSRL